MRLYDVDTGRFGVLLLERNSIREARRWAREALGLGPRTVSAHNEARPVCRVCGSRPCCCAVCRVRDADDVVPGRICGRHLPCTEHDR